MSDPRDARKDQGAKPIAPLWGQERDTLIAEWALHKWERAGKPRGLWEMFWLEAEQELQITCLVVQPPPSPASRLDSAER